MGVYSESAKLVMPVIPVSEPEEENAPLNIMGKAPIDCANGRGIEGELELNA